MKHLISAAAALVALALSTPAYATPLVDNSCQGISCNTDNSTNQTTTNTNSATGGAGGSAVNGPNVNTNVNTAKGGDVSHSGNSFNVNDVDIHNSNRNSNKQGQAQFQGQSIDDSGNASINWQNQRETASAYSPALVASQETCVQSQSAGAQGPAFGISLGFSHDNDDCNRRRNAAMLAAFGNRPAALELLCTDDDVRAAMLAAGTPCRADQQTAPQAQLDGAEGARQAALAPMSPIGDDK